MNNAHLQASRSTLPVENFDGVGCVGCGIELSRKWRLNPRSIIEILNGQQRDWFCTGQQQKSSCRVYRKR